MDNLRTSIEKAFPTTPVPKDRLSDAVVRDHYGDQNVRFEETWETWKNIPNDIVEKCDSVFNMLRPSDSRYYIPRYMFWVLDSIEGKVRNEGLIIPGEHLVMHLLRLKSRNFQGSEFTPDQLKVIEQFLSEIKTNELYEFYFKSSHKWEP